MRLSWKKNLQMGKKKGTNEVVLEDQPFHAPLTLSKSGCVLSFFWVGGGGGGGGGVGEGGP